MNKNRIWILVAICIGVAVQAVATPRSEQAARRIAEMFLKNQTDKSLKRSATNPLTLATTSAKLSAGKKRSAGIPAWYVFNQGSEAFVIVAGDDRMPDILGYSTDGAFVVEGMPSNLRAWLENYTAWADALQAGRVVETAPVQAVPANSPESVAPLLGGISYDQTPPYNNLCPELDGEHCATGCMATAMATIDADVRKTAYANDGDRLRAEAEAKAARAELTGFKDANAVSHQQNMDSMTMTERMIYAASGREKIEDKQILCPKCGMRLDPRAKFCISCGCKLQED